MKINRALPALPDSLDARFLAGRLHADLGDGPAALALLGEVVRRAHNDQ